MNIVVDHFIPCLLGILRLDQGGLLKAFKLNIWAVDRFFVDRLCFLCFFLHSLVSSLGHPSV